MGITATLLRGRSKCEIWNGGYWVPKKIGCIWSGRILFGGPEFGKCVFTFGR